MSLSFELIGPRWNADSPLWVAKVRVIQKSSRREARLVYGDNVSRRLGLHHQGKLPGTMLVHVQIDRVRLNFGNEKGKFFSATCPVKSSFIVTADPSDWRGFLNVNIARMICLQGQFPLEPFFDDDLVKLPSFFGEGLKTVFPKGISTLQASSSGFLFDGYAKMPEQTEPFSNLLPIQLEIAKPQLNNPALGDIVFLLDRERLVDPKYQPGQSDLLKYFQKLVRILNPTTQDNRPKIKWLRLELADLDRLPKFHWLLPIAQPIAQLQSKLVFAENEWRLYISDQSIAEPQTPTRGVMSSTPTVTIDREKVEIKGSDKNLNPTPNGTASYDWSVVSPTEKWTLSNIELTYNPIDVANRLRSIYGLRAPRTDDIDSNDIQDSARLTGQIPTSDGLIDPAVLWGFMPVAEGWAQLPFLNCTEQLLIDSLPEYTGKDRTEIKVESLFRGAAVFGNDREEIYDRNAGQGPWNISLLDAAKYHGSWKFNPDCSDSPLVSIHLDLIDPEITTEGLLEIASIAPTPQDAMPSKDDWVGGTIRLSLRTPLKRLVDIQPDQRYEPTGLAHAVSQPQGAGNYPNEIQSENAEVFPAPFLIRFRRILLERCKTRLQSFSASQPSFSVAKLVQSEWSYEANEFLHLGTISASDRGSLMSPGEAPKHQTYPYPVWLMGLERSRYCASKFWGTKSNLPDEAKSAMVWRKHPTYPTVQNLPLTQNTLPANHLSASRALFPFQFLVERVNDTKPYLRPKSWSFAWDNCEQAYRTVGELIPAHDLDKTHRLVAVPLGLPSLAIGLHGTGLVERELADPTAYLQRLIIRHDLPLLDQPFALAEAPNEDLPSESLPPPPQALDRESYQDHFRKLENRAVLAEADESEAVFKTTSGVIVQGLMEPKVWPANLQVDLNQYPGHATLTDLSTDNTIEWRGENTHQDALRGFDGIFDIDGSQLKLKNDGNGQVKLVAGSMSAISEKIGIENALRDQRGLSRLASFNNLRILSTPLKQESVNSSRSWTLQTSLKAINIAVTGSKPWKLWFKGLPTKGEGPFLFSRAATISNARRGINDPAADGRDFGPLNDYQWILGTSEPKHDQRWLPLGPFRFYSLSLEELELDESGKMISASIIGRLQLPCWNGSSEGGPSNREFTEYDSAVVLEIQAGKVSGIKRAKPDPDPDRQALPQPGCWPLVDTQTADMPLLFWDDLVAEIKNGFLVAIKLPIDKYKIQYTRQGLAWVTTGKSEYRIPLVINDDTLPELEFRVPCSDSDNAGVKSLKLNLDLVNARHKLTAKWIFQMGSNDQLLVEGEWDDEILFASTSSNFQATLNHEKRKRKMKLDVLDAPISLDDFGLSFSWKGFQKDVDFKPTQVQLLPGFHLAETDDSTACRGFLMIAFQRTSQAETLWPIFELSGAYFDIIFDCVWGKSLQDAVRLKSSLDAKMVFGSSSGNVQAEYHSSLAIGQKDPWPWELSLSGLLEVKNVFSWPSSICVGSNGQVTVPTQDDAPGEHWRHTARLLLSQHKISSLGPLDQNGLPIIVGSPDDNIILTLRSGTVWTLPVHVEHQLTQVQAQIDGTFDKGNVLDLRWTAVQEVRIASPKAIYNHLVKMMRQHVINPGIPAINGWDLDNSFNVLCGLSSKILLRDLKVAKHGLILTEIPYCESRIHEIDNYLVVDATTPFFINKTGFPSGGTSNSIGSYLQSALGGMIGVSTSARVDFAHNPRDEAGPEWLFIQVPFMGRLQPMARDEENGDSWLAKDPVQELMMTPASHPLTKWIQAATSRAKNTPVSLQYSPIDRSQLRSFSRLDPASIDEAWFRLFLVREITPSSLQEALPKPTFATAPSDSAVFSARPQALKRLLDPRRTDLPPKRLPSMDLKATKADELVWTYESIAMWNAKIQHDSHKSLDDEHPFAYLPFIVSMQDVIMQDACLLDEKTITLRHASATLIPTPPIEKDNTALFQPVSLAVPAFSSIGFQTFQGQKPSPADDLKTLDSVLRVRLISVAELLVFDTSRKKIEVVSEKLFHTDTDTIPDGDFEAWGTLMLQTMAFDSPSAVVRVREIFAIGKQEGVEVVHRFVEIPYETNAVELRRRSIPIRSSPDRIRFAQGQYGGVKVPSDYVTQVFELAPPLVSGFQPFRMLERPIPNNNDAVPETLTPIWPWGLSAIRVATSYRQRNGEDIGTVGEIIDGKNNSTVWWQACGMRVQYQLSQDRTLLPDGYRTAAIPGFFPTWPSSPLPAWKQIRDALSRSDATPESDPIPPSWSAVLPGRRRILATGLRPGAPYAFREVLVTQDIQESQDTREGIARSVSMTVPVQHRAPHPVLLPRSQPNRHDIALQTWGSWFDLSQPSSSLLDQTPNPAHQTVHVAQSPNAEFIFVKSDGTAEGVRIFATPPTEQKVNESTLEADVKSNLLKELPSYPSQGVVPINWNGKIILATKKLPENATSSSWNVDVSLVVGNMSFKYVESSEKIEQLDQLLTFKVWVPDGVTPSDMVSRARTWQPGQLVEWKLAVGADEDDSNSETGVLGYKQVANLLHRMDDRPFGSPRMPMYLTWEDPEYNRRLTSLTARKEFNFRRTWFEGTTEKTIQLSLALVADRREYNTTGKIVYLVVTQPNSPTDDLQNVDAAFSFEIVKTNGTVTKLNTKEVKAKVNQIPDSFELSSLFDASQVEPGDILRVKVNVSVTVPDTVLAKPSPEPQKLDLSIVKSPVIPTPEAAYAVLRRSQGNDSCARFAWGPEPTRMELLDPDDLKTQIVRRRAVYTTIDVINRSANSVKYAVQKVTPNGGTHFPDIVNGLGFKNRGHLRILIKLSSNIIEACDSVVF
jgi:hypothetical protein